VFLTLSHRSLVASRPSSLQCFSFCIISPQTCFRFILSHPVMAVEEVIDAYGTSHWSNDPPDTVHISTTIRTLLSDLYSQTHGRQHGLTQPPAQQRDAFFYILPLLIVLSTFFFLLLLFLICVIILRKRRGIMLRDNDGPIDMSREDLVEGEGGFEGVESRWLESVNENERRMYLRAKRKSSFRQFKDETDIHVYRIPASVPSELDAYGHHALSVPLHPGEGRLSLVLRA
jgi:hypothetical protein